MKTAYTSDIHHRRSIRLKGYDYSQTGAYFVTICAWNRECLFGDIVDQQMGLNEYGRIIAGKWTSTLEIRKEIELDEFCVMPNHIHGIVTIQDIGIHAVGANGRSPGHCRYVLEYCDAILIIKTGQSDGKNKTGRPAGSPLQT